MVFGELSSLKGAGWPHTPPRVPVPSAGAPLASLMSSTHQGLPLGVVTSKEVTRTLLTRMLIKKKKTEREAGTLHQL